MASLIDPACFHFSVADLSGQNNAFVNNGGEPLSAFAFTNRMIIVPPNGNNHTIEEIATECARASSPSDPARF